MNKETRLKRLSVLKLLNISLIVNQVLKSVNLQCNTLVRWVAGTIDQASDVPSITHTELADSVVTLGGTQGWLSVGERTIGLLDTSSSSNHSWRAAVGLTGESILRTV